MLLVVEALRRTLVSEQEFLQLPESKQKIELLDGEVIVSPSPSYRHQEILRRIIVALSAWARGRDVTIGVSPMDVRFSEGRILQPDAFVLLHRLGLDHEGPIDRVPEICIEVLSTDRAYDRVTKRLIYAAAGVSEYWVVEPAGLIERWQGDALSQAGEHVDSLETPLLDGFTLDVRSLFE